MKKNIINLHLSATTILSYDLKFYAAMLDLMLFFKIFRNLLLPQFLHVFYTVMIL